MNESSATQRGGSLRDERREAVLDLRAAHEAQISAEVEQVELILRLCDLYGADTIPEHHEDSFTMLGERCIPGGALGTPTISEFLCLEIGAALGVSPESAAARIASALELRHRMPRLWQAVQQGEVRVWQASKVVEQTRELSPEACAWVDRHAAPAYPTAGPFRLKTLVDGLVIKADPALAAERAEKALQRRYVRLERDRSATGHAWLSARLDLADAARLDATCDRLAEALAMAGDESDLDQRRATALGMLADPARAAAILDESALPAPSPSAATLVVHLTPEALDDPATAVARVEGHGPVLASQLADLLRHHPRITVQPVLNPAALTPVDSYEIPERIRLAVQLRSPVDAFPHGRRSSTNCDLDHTRRYQRGPGAPPGQTRPGNLQPVSRRAHRGKTHGGWGVTTLPDGHVHWLSPLGLGYLTGPAGTRDATPSVGEATLEVILGSSMGSVPVAAG